MFKTLIIFFGTLFFGTAVLAQEIPAKSSTLVTDYTHTLSVDDVQQLENKLTAFNDSTSTQIAVVIIKSVGESDISEYGQKLGRAWGIGQQGKNNGVLLLVAIADHKVTIQTGYGAEGPLPDVTTNQIIQNDIIPRFKANDYYGGIDAGTNDIIRYMKGEYKSSPQTAQSADGISTGSYLAIIFIVVILIIIILKNRGGGGGGQIYGGRGGASPFWWFLGGAMLGRSSGGWGDSSSDSGGGGGDSGGFGGFGGGDFGGGGSSGSW